MEEQQVDERKGPGRKAKFGEQTKPMRIPLSKLSAVQDLLVNDTDPELLKEYDRIETFLYWLRREKGIYLCEWFEGHNDSYAKIPKGFIKYSGSYQALYEAYRGEKINNVRNTKDDTKQKAKQLAKTFIEKMTDDGLTDKQQRSVVVGLMFEEIWEKLDKIPYEDIAPYIALTTERYLSKAPKREYEVWEL